MTLIQREIIRQFPMLYWSKVTNIAYYDNSSYYACINGLAQRPWIIVNAQGKFTYCNTDQNKIEQITLKQAMVLYKMKIKLKNFE